MARERFRRKDLKRPDEFVSRGRSVLEWAQDNSRLVIQMAAVLLVVAIVGAGFLSYRTARSRQANDDLARALSEYRAAHYAQASAQFAEVAERWSSTPIGNLARIYAAQADIRADNLGNAVSVLEEARQSGKLPPYLQQEVLISLAYAAERNNDLAGAATRYQEA